MALFLLRGLRDPEVLVSAGSPPLSCWRRQAAWLSGGFICTVTARMRWAALGLACAWLPVVRERWCGIFNLFFCLGT